ncbi:MAG TPA: hypothetical protein VEU62_06265 [Bryobacterales bacterium]|nr:hypothetical protein [Bryobacterales bacterium]
MTLREQIEQRRSEWAEFNRWEAEQPAVERSPEEIMADLAAIWDWLPPEARLRDEDPEKLGVQAMRRALSHLKPRP